MNASTRVPVFDDWKSFIHAVLGFTAEVTKHVCPAIPITIVIAFTAYQVRERENPLKKLGDFIEFILGWLVGNALIP